MFLDTLQDETLLASWKQQLDRDVETLKIKGNLHNLRTVSILCELVILIQIVL